ncbi:hypothetical protein [Fluviispira multicolorata]|uniref:Uncharacterized protein n=1 Tax=Fluviispira multicolorata TaxID=2654512 RepID=A0A833JEA9_9BACT|nr:hypothetical protein [Fluviispira multicolorata]KAB8033134.1 hypothetical protein GCL57_00120 [Fluviispira multicolorata]
MYLNANFRLSGWLFPDGKWFECAPWEHLKAAKELPFVVEKAQNCEVLRSLWQHEDEELLRAELAKIGMIKVCYYLVDADHLNNLQLFKLQELFALSALDEDIEFIGRIKIKIQVRIFLKIKDPERLNKLFS